MESWHGIDADGINGALTQMDPMTFVAFGSPNTGITVIDKSINLRLYLAM